MSNPYSFESVMALMRKNYASIIEKIKGMKVLIMDDEMSKMISLVYTHSYLLENEIVLTLSIDEDGMFKEEGVDLNLKYMKVIYIFRPTRENIIKLSNELKSPHFKEYYIFFSNRVNEEELELIAKNDVLELVMGVYEYFIDVYAVNDNLFTLNIPKVHHLYKSDINMMIDDIITRIVSGIYSVCCVVNQMPSIVYKKNNIIVQTVCNRLQADFNNNNLNFQSIIQAYNNYESTNETNGCVLLVLDRKDDCITPILNQWTYQAMIHELLSITNNNKINVDNTEYILNDNDEFYANHLYHEFTDVEDDLNKLISENKQMNNDLTKIMEMLPNHTKAINDTTKHVKILHELSKIIQDKQLLQLGLIEQDIATTNKKNTLNDVIDIINDKKCENNEKLRLSLLYALQSTNENNINKVKDYLKMAKLDHFVNIIDTFLKFHKHTYKSSEFSLSSLKSKFKNMNVRYEGGV